MNNENSHVHETANSGDTVGGGEGLPFASSEDVESSSALGHLSYRQLIWRRFRKNRMGLIAGGVLLLFYIVALGADFFAPYHYNEINMRLRHSAAATPSFFTERWRVCLRTQICPQYGKP